MSEQKTVVLELTVEEVNVVLSVLGELPTNRGTYPLMMKIGKLAERSLKENKDTLLLEE